jgi:hypothetical protein
MNTKLISSSLAIAVICALSSGSAIANQPVESASTPAITTTSGDQTGPLTLSDSRMDSVVAGSYVTGGGIRLPPIFDLCRIIRCPTRPVPTFPKPKPQ